MSEIQGIILGIIQGVLEWLPVSSQGNLTIIMIGIFNTSVEVAARFSVALHAGTLMAAVVYFRREIIQTFKRMRKYRFGFENEEDRLLSFLIVSTLLTGLVGYPIFIWIISINPIQGEIFIALIGIALVTTGLLQRFAKEKRRDYANNRGRMNLRDSILLGLVQGLAVIPGISRSGITTSFLLLRGYGGNDSLRLSFMMSIPAVLAAEVGISGTTSFAGISLQEAALGILFSFLVGLAAIHTLLRVASKISFWKFTVVIGILAMSPLLAYAL